jgi:hypothetical protein
MGFAKFEPGMRGPWPAKQYDQLVNCLGQIINSLALLSGAYGHMDRTWAKRLAENADTLHPSFVRPPLPCVSNREADDRLPIHYVYSPSSIRVSSTLIHSLLLSHCLNDCSITRKANMLFDLSQMEMVIEMEREGGDLYCQSWKKIGRVTWSLRRKRWFRL